jgi:bifunctional ADP-heptose synthase (sugar kinase/adenylyltransferase)
MGHQAPAGDGDVMLDKYIWGQVGRISPEVPVPVVRATCQSQQPSSAANLAMTSPGWARRPR